MRTKTIQYAIITVCLSAAAVLLFMQFTAEKPGSEEGPRVAFYLCSNPDCGTEYEVHPGDAADGRQVYECPDCGSEAADAARCPSCGRFHMLVGHGRYLAECPHCGEKMPPLVEQLRDQ